MSRFKLLERRYTGIHIALLLFILAYLEISKWVLGYIERFSTHFLLIAGLAIMIIKLFILEKDLFNKKYTYIIFKVIELFFVSFFIYYHREVLMTGAMIYLLILLEIFSVDLKLESIFYYFTPFILTGIYILREDFFISSYFIKIVSIILIDVIIVYIIKWIIQGIKESEEQYKELLVEIQEENKELFRIKEHMEDVNKELEQQKEEMKKTSDNFRNSVAELFILREISSYIGSVLEIQQLLELVCDMIMGIMGVDSCIIIVYDERDEKWDFHVKSIYSQEAIETFKTNIWRSSLQKKMKDKEILIDNYAKTKQYGFLEGRNVGSFVAVPLYKGKKSYGLILAEHALENYFSTSSTDLFKAVSMQVAMAIENAKLYEQMEDMAAKDGLTKVYNRMYLQKIMPKLMDEAKRNHHPMTVAIFDIDHFKRFNDTYGHTFGDEVIKTVANLAKRKVEEYGGIIARYGGEEFFMIFPKVELSKTAILVEDLRREIEHYDLKKGDVNAKITASFGVSGYPEIGDTMDELIRTADDAMYLSKHQGRNCTTVAPVTMKCILE